MLIRKLFAGSVMFFFLAGSLAVPSTMGADNTSTILTAHETKEPVTLDGRATELPWRKAQALIIRVQDGSIGKVNLALKALYDKEFVYFFASWPDKTRNVTYGQWVFDPSAQRWTPRLRLNRFGHETFLDNEDRISFAWNIRNSVDGFNVVGCAVLCHGDRMHTNGSGQKVDAWHWKATRTNFVGYTDDGWIDNTVEDGLDHSAQEAAHRGDTKGENAGLAGMNGNYVKNSQSKVINGEPVDIPWYWEPEARGEDALVLSQDEIEDGEAMFVDDVSTLDPKRRIPGYIVFRPKGSRGDIDTRGLWRDGAWFLEMRRRLKTGHDDDVQFDASKIYQFSVAIMDNSGGFESYGSGHSIDLRVRTLQFGGLASAVVGKLILVEDYTVQAEGHMRRGTREAAKSSINNAINIFEEVRDEVAAKDPELYMKIRNNLNAAKLGFSVPEVLTLKEDIKNAILTFQGKRSPTKPAWHVKFIIFWGKIQIYIFVALGLFALVPLYRATAMRKKPYLRSLAVFLLFVLVPVVLEGLGRIGIVIDNMYLQKLSFMTNEYATFLWAILMTAGFAIARTGFAEVDKTIHSLEEKTEKLRTTQNELVQSRKMVAVGQFAAGVAHELNNPLASILGYAQFALQKMGTLEISESDGFGRYLGCIEKESKRCKDIIENLLRFSRGSKGKFEPVDVNSIIKDALDAVTYHFESANIQITQDLGSALPRAIGDRGLLGQVFGNLIMNAKKAMPNGGTLTITSRYQTEARAIEVSITDTGCGIREADVPKIFDPFFTTRQPGEGTGLGLFVSYNIVSEHGGEIKVETSEKGSVFTVCLPRHSNRSGRAETPAF